MKLIGVLIFAALATASPTDYAAAGKYQASSGYQAASTYKASEYKQSCTPYYDTEQKDRCETYSERTCTTTQQESCNDVADQNCGAVVSSRQSRKCFNVTEQQCSLKEDVQYETIEVPFVVQKCQKVTERICYTVFETARTVKEDTQCIDVATPCCNQVENTVYDTTCHTTVSFDCDTSYPTDPYAAAGSSAASDSASASDSSSRAYSTTGYGKQEYNCRRTPETKCYKTPRTVSVEQCSPQSSKSCQKLSSNVPYVQATQNCHDDEKKVCELEQRTQPKQVKKYVYTTQCIPVPRQVCDNVVEKSLVPNCVGTIRKQCTYSPVEFCEDSPKKYCYKYSYQVQKQQCEYNNKRKLLMFSEDVDNNSLPLLPFIKKLAYLGFFLFGLVIFVVGSRKYLGDYMNEGGMMAYTIMVILGSFYLFYHHVVMNYK